MGTIARRGWPMGLVLLLAACSSPSEYACEADAQCVDIGVMGVCQEPGWCSFPDDTCPSGQRYGDHAGDGLAKSCVPPGGTSAEGSSTAGSTATTPSTLDTTDPATESVSDTLPLTGGEQSTGEMTSLSGPDGTMSSTDPTTGPMEGSSTDLTTGPDPTTGEPDPCPTYVDDFEDGVIGNEWILSFPEYVSESGGARVFDVTVEWDVYPSTHLADSLDFTQGWLRVEIGAHPISYSEQLFIEFSPFDDQDDNLFWFIEGNELMARWDFAGMGWTQIATEPFDPELHRWLQIRTGNGTIYFEAGPDEASFDTIATFETPFDLSSVSVGIFAGNYALLDAPVQLSWTHLELCTGQ